MEETRTLLTTREWGPMLRITEENARRWMHDPVKRRRLRAVRIGRYWLVPAAVIAALGRGEDVGTDQPEPGHGT